jgi:fatty acid desaturase
MEQSIEDTNEHMWTIHGKSYDLNHFLKWHPGGELALLLGKGRDCTVLYEQYHVRNTNHIKTLQAVADKQGLGPVSGGCPDPFFSELCEEIRRLPDTKTTVEMCIFLAVVGVATGAAWVGWFNGSWIACVLLPWLHWLMTVNMSHDAGHFAFSHNSAINNYSAVVAAPLYYNSTYWYLQHDVSHHSHTNKVDKDIDLYHLAPFVRFHPDQQWRGYHTFQLGTVVFINFIWATFAETVFFPFMLLFGDKTTRDFFGHIQSVLNFTRWSVFLQLGLCGLVVGYPFAVWGPYFFKAWFFAIYPYAMASMIFMTITQISHIQASAQKPRLENSAHWSHIMVDSSVDYAQDSLAWTVFTGGLNMQSLHHCVPVLSSSRYREFYPKFRALCVKHGRVINEVPNIWNAITSYWLHIWNLSFQNVGLNSEVTAARVD